MAVQKLPMGELVYERGYKTGVSYSPIEPVLELIHGQRMFLDTIERRILHMLISNASIIASELTE